ncbi:MAG: thioredoxin domain-containing protein, partial [Desulfuromonadales bacterium]|nr:thioredoxin domain-containing protein [Desulfuromonadales bacterium]
AQLGANQLITEKSPYLLQHAHNPVAWYPWNDQAFAEARKQQKLIFLSIGYSTCHWCHVMAHESFEDDEVAALLNKDYISIKVDREERPDIDTVYMEVCQRLTGSGGWPLTIIMTPEAVPVFAATYIPKQDGYGRAGMMSLLPLVAQKWRESPDEIRQSGRRILESLKQATPAKSETTITASEINQAVAEMTKRFDAKHGGFSAAPKFPSPHGLTFLLRRYHKSGDKELLAMVEKTLRSMRHGGIYDHVGYGFHRYATDSEWLVPHFEKMLYDQAGLAMAYTEAFQLTDNPIYAQTVREIFTYLQRDMTSPQGGFYAAEDADSEGVEGKFYLWTKAEIEAVLGKKESARLQTVFSVSASGNYHDEATGEKTGGNIPHLSKSLQQWAQAFEISPSALEQELEQGRAKLFAARELRVHPHLDDKIITAWNGWMISALARGGQALNEPEYVAAAARAADFVLKELRDKDGRLLRRYRQGEAAITGFSEDYAYMALGLLDLYAANYQSERIEQAILLAEQLANRFQDIKSGILYDTATDAEALLMRPQSSYDGAMPAASSIALEVYTRLFLLTGREQWRQYAFNLLKSLTPTVARYPSGYTQLLQSAALLIEPTREVVISGETDSALTIEMLAAIRHSYAPQSVTLLRTSSNAAALSRIAPFVEEMTSASGKSAA